MRLHAFLFSRSCVSVAIRSHSAANFLNSSDRFIERPSDIGLPDIPNFSQSQMCQSQTIQGVTFSNAEMQHSFAAAHSSSLVIETRLYKVPRLKCGDSNRELRPNDPSTHRFRSAASRSRRSVWRRADECHLTFWLHLTGGRYSK